MDLALVRFLAQTFGVAFTASPRPAATFACIQVTVAVCARMGWVAVAPELSWLVSVPALVICGALAAVEFAALLDPEINELLLDLKVAHLVGAFGAFSSCLLFHALGLPDGEAMGMVDAAPAQDLGLTLNLLAASEQDDATRYGAVAGALALNGGMTAARARIIAFLAAFDLDKQWHRVEAGGVLGLLTLVVWLPALALAIVAALALALGGFAAAAVGAERWADRRNRVACPACGASIRAEASVCFQCGEAVSPSVVLGTAAGGRVRRMLAALRRRPAPAA